jgi:hypothetical protein
MLSFRVDDSEANEAQQWAEALGIDRSERHCCVDASRDVGQRAEVKRRRQHVPSVG